MTHFEEPDRDHFDLIEKFTDPSYHLLKVKYRTCYLTYRGLLSFNILIVFFFIYPKQLTFSVCQWYFKNSLL